MTRDRLLSCIDRCLVNYLDLLLELCLSDGLTEVVLMLVMSLVDF